MSPSAATCASGLRRCSGDHRPVATGAGLDPMIAQASAPRPKPRPDKKLDFSSCPTRRLQAMLRE